MKIFIIGILYFLCLNIIYFYKIISSKNLKEKENNPNDNFPVKMFLYPVHENSWKTIKLSNST